MTPPISSVGDLRKSSVDNLRERVIPDLVSEERAESVGNHAGTQTISEAGQNGRRNAHHGLQVATS
jgi:hypothetical protein